MFYERLQQGDVGREPRMPRPGGRAHPTRGRSGPTTGPDPLMISPGFPVSLSRERRGSNIERPAPSNPRAKTMWILILCLGDEIDEW
jgi:hypothetical protein